MARKNAHLHFHPDLTGNALCIYALGYSIFLWTVTWRNNIIGSVHDPASGCSLSWELMQLLYRQSHWGNDKDLCYKHAHMCLFSWTITSKHRSWKMQTNCRPIWTIFNNKMFTFGLSANVALSIAITGMQLNGGTGGTGGTGGIGGTTDIYSPWAPWKHIFLFNNIYRLGMRIKNISLWHTYTFLTATILSSRNCLQHHHALTQMVLFSAKLS